MTCHGQTCLVITCDPSVKKIMFRVCPVDTPGDCFTGEVLHPVHAFAPITDTTHFVNLVLHGGGGDDDITPVTTVFG